MITVSCDKTILATLFESTQVIWPVILLLTYLSTSSGPCPFEKLSFFLLHGGDWMLAISRRQDQSYGNNSVGIEMRSASVVLSISD